MNIRLVFIAFILFNNLSTAFCQIGTKDSTFGTNGQVITSLGSWNMVPWDIAQQKDGKTIVLGAGNSKMILIRYDVNGNLDGTFGSGGVAYSPTSLSSLIGYKLGLQDDGKIVAVGTSGTATSTDFAICRFDSTGLPDPSFNLGNVLKVDFNLSFNVGDYAKSILIGKNGTMYIAGYTGNSPNQDFAILKLKNGGLVNTFGISGKATYDFNGENDMASDIDFLPNGKIVVGGHSQAGGVYNFSLLCIDTNGVIDASFGNNGKSTINIFGSNSTCSSVAVDESGNIFMAGGYYNAYIAKFGSDGIVDSTFGTNGLVSNGVNGNAFATGISIQKDRKILITGETGNGGNYRFMAIRYHPNGTLDYTFGQLGIAIFYAPINSISYQGRGHVVQADGKIVITGPKSLNNVYEFATVRFKNAIPYFNVYPDTIPQNWIATNEAMGTQPITYTWDWGDGNTSTGATPSHIYAAPGYYNICLTISDATNCSSTYCDSSTYLYKTNEASQMVYISTQLGPLTVGINETFESTPIVAFPNPVIDELTINGKNISNVKIYDILGNEIKNINKITYETSGCKINLSNLKQGIYIARLGNRTVRFIKD